MPENHNPDVMRISRFGTAAREVGMSREGLEDVHVRERIQKVDCRGTSTIRSEISMVYPDPTAQLNLAVLDQSERPCEIWH